MLTTFLTQWKACKVLIRIIEVYFFPIESNLLLLGSSMYKVKQPK